VRVAVISDVHSNLAALEAVLEALPEHAVDEIWCLGDLVGYGPQPDQCVHLVTSRAAVCLAGNHDLVVSGAISSSVFTHDAGAAAAWTREVMTPETEQALQGLEPSGARQGVELYHASIRDPVWEYVIDDRTAMACIELQNSPLALIGHSHVALVYGYAGERFLAGTAPAGTELELGPGPYLLNPGSVGQPRDGDPRAAFLILDLDGRTAAWRRVEYDIDRTRQAIDGAGLPARLGTRLYEGR
jgi:diadenosine tetraphosphatase ApaH/serine/threonine PP2A family protein phosphatase